MKSLLFLILFIVASLFTYAQTAYPVLAMELVNTPLYIDEQVGISDTTVYNASMQITLYDTTGIENLRVKLGRADGTSDLLSQTFEYDQPISGSFSYSRNGYQVILGLGHYPNMIKYYAELIVERSDHSLSSPIIFSR